MKRERGRDADEERKRQRDQRREKEKDEERMIMIKYLKELTRRACRACACPPCGPQTESGPERYRIGLNSSCRQQRSHSSVDYQETIVHNKV